MKIFETNITPTPSPRIKKRLRREQFLQEHKQMGKIVLAMAKAPVSPEDISIKQDDNTIDQVYYICCKLLLYN